jgi:hypothetical protein
MTGLSALAVATSAAARVYRPAAFLILALLGAVPAFGAMTEAELRTAKNLVVTSATLATTADAVLGQAVTNTTDATRPTYYFSLLYLNRAAQRLNRTHALLVGGFPDADSTPLQTKTRQELVALAWQEFDRARADLVTAKGYLATLPPNSVAANNQAKTESQLNAVDRTLTFLEPLLPKRFDMDTTIKVFGPHGHYEKVINAWAAASRLLYDAADQLIRAYNVAGFPSAALGDYKIALRATMANASVMQHSTARLYGLKFTTDDAAIQGRTFQILAVLHDVLKRGPSEDHGLAYFMRQSTEQTALVYPVAGMPQAAKDLLFHSRQTNDKAWAEMDFGTYLMMTIVDCVSTSGLPIANCGGRGMVAD